MSLKENLDEEKDETSNIESGNDISDLPGYNFLDRESWDIIRHSELEEDPLSENWDPVAVMLRISFRYRRAIRTFILSTVLCLTILYAGKEGFLGYKVQSYMYQDRGNALDMRIQYFWGNMSKQYIFISRKTANRINDEPDICRRFEIEPGEPKISMSSVWADLNKYDESEITMVTQMSLGRLSVLPWMLSQWEGPVSLTIYVQWEELQQVPHLLAEIPELMSRNNIDVHFVLSTGEFYPVNFMRNLALRNVRTNYIFLSDVDFVPMPGAHSAIQRHIEQGLLDGKRTLVVPGFEYLETPEEYPSTKQELLQEWAEGKVQPFHDDRNGGVGHHSTDSEKWKTATDPYTIVPEGSYEPYLVFRKDQVHPYEERFLGRMFDKVVHTLQAVAQGFEFVVLPDVYSVHMPHPQLGAAYQNCSIDMFYTFKKDIAANHLDTMGNYNFKPEWQIKAKEEQAAHNAAEGAAT